MTIDEIYRNLCWYDKRNPSTVFHDLVDVDECEIPNPREKGCSCDNCFYGRDQLAVELLKLIQQYTNTTNTNTP